MRAVPRSIDPSRHFTPEASTSIGAGSRAREGSHASRCTPGSTSGSGLAIHHARRSRTNPKAPPSGQSPRPYEEVEQGNLFYELRWEKVKGTPSDRINLEGHWLLVADAKRHAERLAQSFESRGGSCTIAAPSSVDIDDGATTFRGVIYLAGLDCEPTQDLSRHSIETDHGRLLNEVIHLARSLEKPGRANQPRLWIVTRGAQPVGVDGAALNLVQSSLWGLARSIALENPEIWGGIIDLDPRPVDAEDEANQLADAIGLVGVDDQRAFRQRQRFVPVHCRDSNRRKAGPNADFEPWRHLSDHRRSGRPGASGRSLAC